MTGGSDKMDVKKAESESCWIVKEFRSSGIIFTLTFRGRSASMGCMGSKQAKNGDAEDAQPTVSVGELL